MQKEGIKIINAIIKLPVEVYTNGEFKMLYDQMVIQMDMEESVPLPIAPNIDIIPELEEEEEEEEDKDKVKEEDTEYETPIEEDKIYKKDYPKKRKKRLNTSFRKNIHKHNISKRAWSDSMELIKQEINDYFVPPNLDN